MELFCRLIKNKKLQKLLHFRDLLCPIVKYTQKKESTM